MRLISMPKCNCCKSCCKACQSPISCNPVLKAHYDYWDKFVQEWKNQSWANINSMGWNTPTFYGNDIVNNPGICTTEFLPEPWWGNNGMHPISAVVINLNPGAGGNFHLHSNLQYIRNYSSFVDGLVGSYVSNNNPVPLGIICEWHYNNRALPIFEALQFNGVNLSGNDSLNNILSLELIPWHSMGWNNLGKYPQIHSQSILDHVIKFAAEASRCIQNERLNRCVIVRTSLANIQAIFKGRYTITQKETKIGISKYAEIRFNNIGIDDVRFVLIWQEKQLSRNNLPHCTDFIKIIQKI